MQDNKTYSRQQVPLGKIFFHIKRSLWANLARQGFGVLNKRISISILRLKKPE
jgi:hypothetical protein